ncbi:MAG: Fe-S protein assembly co-chaperone HscB [Wolbachia endosymbiont of Xenopsylla cheopis]
MSDYFTLFNIQPKFDIDLDLLEKKYIELNKTFHPDNCTLDHEKSIAVKDTININKAYQILKSPLKRAEYLLSLLNAAKNCKVDPEILEESMQIRESIFIGDDKQVLTKTIEDKMKECIRNLKNSFANNDLNKAAGQLHRLKYLNKSYERGKVELIQISDPHAPTAFGIDFGTTNSLIAAVDENNNVHIFKDEYGKELLYSAISYSDGTIKVGSKSDANAIYSIKRLLGKGPDDVEEIIGKIRFNYEISSHNGTVKIDLGNGKYLPPVEIAADIIKALCRRVKKRKRL